MDRSVVPESELSKLVSLYGVNKNLDDMYGIMSDIQTCYWKYIDEHNIADLFFKQFAMEMFRFLPYLRQFTKISIFMKLHREFVRAKKRMPVSGAILLSKDDKCVLLVQSYRTEHWSFPRGKIEAQDVGSFEHCALREVYEETSIKIDKLLVPDDFIELMVNQAVTHLFVIRDVSMTPCEPRMKNEIKQCKWFEIANLRETLNDNQSFSVIDSFLRKLGLSDNREPLQTVGNENSAKNL